MSVKTLKQVAMAEKLSIPQLQQAVKNGTIESWIGIPMIQERMKEQKESQAMATAQQPQPPKVAEQVLMEAAQQGLEALPTNLPQEYASGGIIGYADGGETDEAYQQYLDDADEEEFQQYAEAMLNRTPDVEKGIRSAPSMSYGQVQGQQLRAARQPESEGRYDASGHKYDSLVNEESKKIGLPANLGRYMLHRETGGLKDPDTARSKAGAYGPAQLMPATAKELGVDIRNPEENVKGGLRYLKKMYDRYNGDEALALAAYNAGPGNVDKALKSGKGIAGLPTETRGYVKFAEGGAVGYKAGDLIDIGDLQVEETNDPNYVIADGVKTKRSLVEQSAASPWNTRPKGEPPVDLSGTSDFIGDLKTGAKKTAAAAADIVRLPVYGIDKLIGTKYMDQTPTPFYDKYIRGAETTAAEKPAAAPEAAKPTAQAQASSAPATEGASQDTSTKGSTTGQTGSQQAPQENAYNDLMKLIRDRMANREKEKDQDKWMGLLSAGLGMMGGTSPYASTNIGQGAMYGLQQYGQARKQSAAEEAADLKSMITASRYRDIGEHYKQKGAETLDYKNRELAERERSTATNQYKAYADMLMDNIRKEHMLANGVPGPGYKAAVEAMNKDPYLLQLRNRAFGQSQFKLLTD